MRKANRLFQVVTLIRAHQPTTASTLAAWRGISARTIYRFIDDLSENSASGALSLGENGSQAIGVASKKHIEISE